MRKRKYPLSGNMGKKPYRCNLGCMRIISGFAVTQWLKERLRLDVSPEKTRVVDVRRSYSEFLGFKIRLRKKGKKYVVQSHMCDKAYSGEAGHALIHVRTRCAAYFHADCYSGKYLDGCHPLSYHGLYHGLRHRTYRWLCP